MTKSKDIQKKDVVYAYYEKKISRSVAAARLCELGYEEWEINLYLDNDQTGPE